jgi:hypothetical protein
LLSGAGPDGHPSHRITAAMLPRADQFSAVMAVAID